MSGRVDTLRNMVLDAQNCSDAAYGDVNSFADDDVCYACVLLGVTGYYSLLLVFCDKLICCRVSQPLLFSKAATCLNGIAGFPAAAVSPMLFA